jgi:transposase
MNANLKDTLAHHWFIVQKVLFPHLLEQEGLLSERHKQLIAVLEFARVERFISSCYGRVGRPQEDRRDICRAFIAKAVFNIPTTVLLREYLQNDATLRRICGFQSRCAIPSESTFSRAFREFASTSLLDYVHAALIQKYQSEHLVWHISRDSTAIDARERVDPARKEEMKQKELVEKEKKESIERGEKTKRGRPKKGQERPPVPQKRLEKQCGKTLDQMLNDIPTVCDIGTKRNAHGNCIRWKGYKLHLDTANGGIPISAILTSASSHDSQLALPLSLMTSARVDYLYEVMDAAYDSAVIREQSLRSGHVPLIDFNRRSPKDTRSFTPHEKEHYKERSVSERMNARLKDEFGARMIYVRGDAKIKAHLMLGVIALTVDQLIRLVQ